MCFGGWCGTPVYGEVRLEDKPRVHYPNFHHHHTWGPGLQPAYGMPGYGRARAVYYKPAQIKVVGPKYANQVRSKLSSSLHFRLLSHDLRKLLSSFDAFACLLFSIFPQAFLLSYCHALAPLDLTSSPLFPLFVLRLNLISLNNSNNNIVQHYTTPIMAFMYPGFGFGYGGPQSMWTPSPWPIPTAHLPQEQQPAAQPAAPASDADTDEDSDIREAEEALDRERQERRRRRHRESAQAVPERERRPHSNGAPVDDAESVQTSGTAAFWGPPNPFGYPVCDSFFPLSQPLFSTSSASFALSLFQILPHFDQPKPS
jgi:hypothetical protein